MRWYRQLRFYCIMGASFTCSESIQKSKTKSGCTLSACLPGNNCGRYVFTSFFLFAASQPRILKAMVVCRPELYLDELSDWLATVTGKRITVSAVCNYLIRLGFTRRKLSILYERDDNLRAKFTRLVSQFRPEQHIFIDESSKDDRNANRYYGYLPKGTRHFSGLGHFVRKHRVSLLAAIDIPGIKEHLWLKVPSISNYSFWCSIFYT